jgi:hypothetical protein
LNFYRALEASVGGVQGAKARREALFSKVPTESVRPVYAEVRDFSDERRNWRLLDVNRKLRASARARYGSLLSIQGSAAAALDHLAREGRGKAAHADVVSLEYDRFASLAEQVLDAELLEYFARIAIEANW